MGAVRVARSAAQSARLGSRVDSDPGDQASGADLRLSSTLQQPQPRGWVRGTMGDAGYGAPWAACMAARLPASPATHPQQYLTFATFPGWPNQQPSFLPLADVLWPAVNIAQRRTPLRKRSLYPVRSLVPKPSTHPPPRDISPSHNPIHSVVISRNTVHPMQTACSHHATASFL